jgi:hypothetical protein
MSKFRIKMKLQGLELEVEGTREEAPLIAESLGRQFAGFLQPAAQIVEGETEALPSRGAVQPATGEDTSPSRKRTPRRKRSTASSDPDQASSDSDSALDWRHDPAKWGSPRQEWNTANKAIWLLYIAGNETDQKELSAKRITNTFNKHFKQAGLILVHNVVRDLGKQKVGKDATVSEDTTQDPAPWFLTDAGTRRAQQLVAEALGQTGTAPSDTGA